MANYSDQPTRGQRIKLVITVVCFLGAIGILAGFLLRSSPADYALERGFKCSQCGYDYVYTIQSDEIEPLPCPKCSQKAAYQAELCYWTKGPNGEWQAKKEPTLVILKKRIDSESTEQTICPDCGREVVGHNPPPPADLLAAAQDVRD